MDNTNESKAERFVRLAEPRVSRACKAISLIGHLAASSYEYTDKQVESMFEALQDELNTQKAKFTKKGTDRPTMRLNANVSVLSAKQPNISVSLSKSSTPFLRMHRTTQSRFGFWLSLSGLWQTRISFISARVGRTHAAV